MATARHIRTNRRRILLTLGIVTCASALLLAGGVAFAAYRYERARADLILPGVTVAGVDVGGMTRTQAEHAVRAATRLELGRSLTVTVGSQRWVLTEEALGRRADVADAVDRALAAGQGLGAFDRFWHRFSHESLNEHIDVAYSTHGDQITELVSKLAAAVAVPAKDASIGITVNQKDIVPIHAEDGQTLVKARAETAIRHALDHNIRSVHLRTRVVKPSVTDANLGRTIVVRLDRNRLYLYKGFHVQRTWPVATAKPGFTTPNGIWQISGKQVDPTWYNPAPNGWGAGEPLVVGPGPGNPMGIRALYLTAPGLIVIHGTNDPPSIGRYASHGCIRMYDQNVVQLYRLVPVGTHVIVVGHRPPGAQYWSLPPG